MIPHKAHKTRLQQEVIQLGQVTDGVMKTVNEIVRSEKDQERIKLALFEYLHPIQQRVISELRAFEERFPD